MSGDKRSPVLKACTIELSPSLHETIADKVDLFPRDRSLKDCPKTFRPEHIKNRSAHKGPHLRAGTVALANTLDWHGPDFTGETTFRVPKDRLDPVFHVLDRCTHANQRRGGHTNTLECQASDGVGDRVVAAPCMVTPAFWRWRSRSNVKRLFRQRHWLINECSLRDPYSSSATKNNSSAKNIQSWPRICSPYFTELC